jgi:hypothetical protein
METKFDAFLAIILVEVSTQLYSPAAFISEKDYTLVIVYDSDKATGRACERCGTEKCLASYPPRIIFENTETRLPLVTRILL